MSLEKPQAKVLFWRLVKTLKPEDNSDFIMDIVNSKIDDLSSDVKLINENMQQIKSEKTQHQIRREELEKKLSPKTYYNSATSEVALIEEQIGRLERLSKHYKKSAPEHKVQLKKIETKLNNAKKKLEKIKQKY